MKSLVTSIILKVIYGHDIDKTKYDYVELILEADARVAAEGSPGTTIFDILPFCEQQMRLPDVIVNY